MSRGIRILPFLMAVAFLTRLPVPKLQGTTEDWQKSVNFYPVVGLLISLLLWGAASLSSILFPLPLASVLTLVLWIYVTGGLHLDGWMDLADGLGSNRSREKLLEIMKDSRVGAMGVIAAVLLMMVKTSAVYELQAGHLLNWLMLPAFTARFILVVTIWHWPYISEKGLATGLRQGLTFVKLCAGFLFTLLVVFLLFKIKGVLIFFLLFPTSLLFAHSVQKRLGGLNGDCYGAVVEWTETVTLLLILLAWRWIP